jgi:hypothetical protein
MASRTARKNGIFWNGLLIYKVKVHFCDKWTLDNPTRLIQLPSSLDAWLLSLQLRKFSNKEASFFYFCLSQLWLSKVQKFP